MAGAVPALPRRRQGLRRGRRRRVERIARQVRVHGRHLPERNHHGPDHRVGQPATGDATGPVRRLVEQGAPQPGLRRGRIPTSSSSRSAPDDVSFVPIVKYCVLGIRPRGRSAIESIADSDDPGARPSTEALADRAQQR
ncbi:MAG: hypothetical protein U5R31_15010 [Acidimicrobiia bacterium]|nr:hypothetical protein [Acidimicrobiia bacterium]